MPKAKVPQKIISGNFRDAWFRQLLINEKIDRHWFKFWFEGLLVIFQNGKSETNGPESKAYLILSPRPMPCGQTSVFLPRA